MSTTALLLFAAAHAAPDGIVPIQGAITEAEGPVTGARAVRVTLWSNAARATDLWHDDFSVDFVDGAFALTLGTGAPLDLALFSGNPDLHLGVQLIGDPESSLVPVGYAPRAAAAANADRLGGLDPSAYRLSATPIAFSTLTGVPGQIATGTAFDAAVQALTYGPHNVSAATTAITGQAGFTTAVQGLSYGPDDLSALTTSLSSAFEPLGASVAIGRLPVGSGSATTVARTDDPRFPAARMSALRVASAGNFAVVGGTRVTTLNGVDRHTAGRGLNLVVIDRTTHAFVSSAVYDTEGSASASTSFAAALDALDSTKFVVITASDAWTTQLGTSAKTALRRCGATNYTSSPFANDGYVLVGICGRGTGTGFENRTRTETLDHTLTLAGGEVLAPVQRRPGFHYVNCGTGAFAETAGFTNASCPNLSFQTNGGPVMFHISLGLNDDIGIGSPEVIRFGCRIRLDQGTSVEQVILLGLQWHYNVHNVDFLYSYSTIAALPGGAHTARLECLADRAGSSNMHAGLQNGWETPSQSGNALQNTFGAIELGW
jgi:hypothetical protein